VVAGDELIQDDDFVGILATNHSSLLLEEVVALVLLDILDDEFVGLGPFGVLGGNLPGDAPLLLDLLLVDQTAVYRAHLVRL
jgi:hypothetical protein